MRKLLWPLTFLYAAIIWLRNYLFDTGFFTVYQAPRPVIAIGNLSTGGTGKTPFAEYLIRNLVQKGLAPAYLSRGYGRKSKGYVRVLPQEMDAEWVGDEALQVATRFPLVPVAVCEDRQTGIRRLMDEVEPQLFVLDDAFQHRRVARDLNIVMIDANRLPSDELLLPAGNLREPICSLKRADLLVVNKVQYSADLDALEKKVAFRNLPVAFCRPEPQAILQFSGTPFSLPAPARVVLFSGIGNNESFRSTVADLGIEVLAAYAFRDHYAFQEADLERIIGQHFHHSPSSANFAPPFLLTTEKDFFRMRNLPWLDRFTHIPLTYLPIRLVWLKGESLISDLLKAKVMPV